MIDKIEHVEQDFKNMNRAVIDVQKHVESNHDEFMQYVDAKFEEMMRTRAFMVKNTKDVEKNNDEKTTNDEESEESIDENSEKKIIEEYEEIDQITKKAIIEEGDTKIENTENLDEHMVKCINGKLSIEEFFDLSEESEGVDQS